MHDLVMEWVAGYAKLADGPVLEVGSRDINGTVRPLFPQDGYVGLDVEEGEGVDLVYDGETLPFLDGWFGTVVSTEMLEHALDPPHMIREMIRVLRPGGRLILTARTNGFPFHNPPDRWRLMPGTLTELCEREGCEAVEIPDPHELAVGAFVFAVKL